MNNVTTKNDFKKLPLWYRIITVILVIILIFFMFTLISELREDTQKYYSDPDYLSYRVESRLYTTLYENTQDLANDNKYNPSSYDRYTALGEYYNSALVYYALRETDPEEAARFKAVMDDAAGRVGDLADQTETIDKLLTFSYQP